MKHILMACGTGICTSSAVRERVCQLLDERGYAGRYDVTQCRMIELHDKANDYDLVVTSGKFSDPDVKTPCIMAISLLTGINEGPTLQKILAALKD